MSEAGLVSLVEIDGGVARVRQNGGAREFAIKELPESFVRWQLDYKHRIYDAIEKDEYVRFNAGHLPVVGTWKVRSSMPSTGTRCVPVCVVGQLGCSSTSVTSSPE